MAVLRALAAILPCPWCGWVRGPEENIGLFFGRAGAVALHTLRWDLAAQRLRKPGATLALCAKAGQTHPGHPLQTAFTARGFRHPPVGPRGARRLGSSPAAVPRVPGAWPERVVALWEEATTSCLDVRCLTHGAPGHGASRVHLGTKLIPGRLRRHPRTGLSRGSSSPSFSSVLVLLLAGIVNS